MPEGRKDNKENEGLLVLLYLFIPQWIKKTHMAR